MGATEIAAAGKGIGPSATAGGAGRGAPRLRIGELLVADGLLSHEQLREALHLQQRWGTRLGDIVLAKGWVRPYDFYRTLASHLGRPFVTLIDHPPDPDLIDPARLRDYTEHLVIPWVRDDGTLLFATADPGPAATTLMERLADGPWDYVVTSKFDIIWQVQRFGDRFLSAHAVNELAERQPEHSAREVFTGAQLGVIYAVLSALLAAVTFWPVPTLIALNAFIAGFLLLNFGLRMLFAWVGGDPRVDVKVTDEEVRHLDDADLPTYTVLVPMYREPAVLPIITESLRSLDYPLSRLDVKLILEEDDDETIAAAKELGLEGIFEIIRVPDSQPKTKPKACNYALSFARGELVTIYDAEDKPEPDQLKKAVLAFRKAPANTAVIQARLNYFNATENWLTRMFTLEYSLWFDFYLPALEALNIPIPLGGTSNHFRMHVLREVDAWDPYNVTEDADLGVRFTQLDYRVGVVNSTTYEEANKRVGNWIRQRSRWIKGYMQTYLVHMRRPLHLYRSLGHVGFWGFQFFIGGAVLSTLLAPVLFGLYAVWLLTQTHVIDVLFPPLVLYLSLFNLLIGNGLLIYLSTLSVFKRHLYRLIPWALTVPAYWMLMSVAAYKALWQLIHRPFYWEKTEHGLTTFEARVQDHG